MGFGAWSSDEDEKGSTRPFQSKVAQLSLKRKAEQQARNKKIIGSDDEDSEEDKKTKKAKPFISAVDNRPKSVGILGFLPPPKNVPEAASNLADDVELKLEKQIANSSAAANTNGSSMGSRFKINQGKIASGYDSSDDDGVDAGNNNAESGLAFTTNDVDYGGGFVDSTAGSNKATGTSTTSAGGDKAKPTPVSIDNWDSDEEEQQIQQAQKQNPVLQSELQKQQAKDAFLAQYGGANALSKQDLKDLSEAFESQQLNTLASTELFNEKWLEQNPSYMASLHEKADRANAQTQDEAIVGFQVEAGSTTQVTQKQKQKHQITYLAAMARSAQGEINAQLSAGRGIRQEAGSKYGWR
ncbi:unnamed protein product [Amoebophrya sp. A120]|nr:unnamed protein product [Amoebophrya sp. A120]|eukprot:GSA120T00012922001.1